MSDCTGVYLRRSCHHLPEAVPLVTPFNLTNYSSYGKFSEELLTILAEDDGRVAVLDQVQENISDPEQMMELLQMSAEIRQKVDEIKLLVITATIDHQMMLGELVKETCPAIEALNYTCPPLICSGKQYMVTLEWDFLPAQFAFVMFAIASFVWRKRYF
jgi:hypothetical protein